MTQPLLHFGQSWENANAIILGAIQKVLAFFDMSYFLHIPKTPPTKSLHEIVIFEFFCPLVVGAELLFERLLTCACGRHFISVAAI